MSKFEREFYTKLESDGSGDASAYTDYADRTYYVERVTATLETSAAGGTLTIKAPAVLGRALTTLYQSAITSAAGIDDRPYRLGQLNTTGADISNTSVPVILRMGERLQVVGSSLNGNGTLKTLISLSTEPYNLSR